MASRLRYISEAIALAPDTDMKKVKAVREALSRGAYEVDPSRIADKLIDLDTALHRSRRTRT